MDTRLIKPNLLPKPLLLKDYLLDDLGSCSSNGFKSFPRRQCCTTVRFLLEIDLKNKHNYKQSTQKRNHFDFDKKPPTIPKKPSNLAFSTFQSVITAVKRLPFSFVEKKKSGYSFLPGSFSRKFLKKSGFWKRKSIQRWKSFDELLKEDSEAFDRSTSSVTTECSSGNFSSGVNLNLPEMRKDVVKVAVSDDRVVVTNTNGDVSTGSTSSNNGSASTNSSRNIKQKQWSNEEKEQFSPVSVLDCPFDDEDEVSSPFQHRIASMEGTKKKLMKKIQKFKSLTQLEPVNLAKLFALVSISESESTGSLHQIDVKEEEEKVSEQKAMELLQHMKDTLPSYGLKLNSDKLLLDFFIEKISDSEKQLVGYSFDEEVLEEAERWINERERRGLLVDWEVKKNKEAYIKDMEKGRKWKILDQEKEELALELENEFFVDLLDDLVMNISTKVMI